MRKWEALLEIERLRLTSPEAVYRELSALSRPEFTTAENLPEEIVEFLLSRGDELIDLGIARYTSTAKRVEKLWPRGGMIRLALLGNQNAREFVPPEEVKTLLESGNQEEMQAFLTNQGVDAQLLAGIIRNEYGVTENRWQHAVFYAIQNPCLLQDNGPARDTFDALMEKSRTGEPIYALWELIDRVEPTQDWAYVLRSLPLEIPLRGQKDKLQYAKRICEKWLTPKEYIRDGGSEGVNSEPFLWRWIREVVANHASRGFVYDDDKISFLRNSPDQATRLGYYAGSEVTESYPAEEFFSRDGDEFLWALVNYGRNSLYLRRNWDVQRSVTLFFGRMRGSSDDLLRDVFRRGLEARTAEDPERYGSDPPEHVQAQWRREEEQEEEEERAKRFQADRKHRSRVRDNRPLGFILLIAAAIILGWLFR